MDADELARLNEALARGFESIKAGRLSPAADVISNLLRRRLSLSTKPMTKR